MVHLDLTLTDEQVHTLKTAAEQQGVAIDAVVQQAIDEYIQKLERKLELQRPQYILSLPDEERDRLMAEAAAAAEDEYRNNPELTAFEANEIYDYD
jgi:hypothetical protein